MQPLDGPRRVGVFFRLRFPQITVALDSWKEVFRKQISEGGGARWMEQRHKFVKIPP